LDYDRALELLEQVQKARPNYPPDFIGYIQRRQGKWEKCLTNLGIAFKLNPRNAWLAYELAGTNSNMRRYDKAEVWVNRALSIDPRLLDAQLRKVILHILANGNAKEARASLETLPKNKHTDDLRIYVSTLGRNYQEVVDFIEYLPYDSFDAQNYYFNKYLTLASVYFTKNEIPLMITNAETARMELEKRVQERPDDPRFRAAFGLACAYSGRKQEAIEEGNRAVQLYPVSKDALDGPFYLLNLAKICAIVEEYEEAIDRLEYLMSIPAGEIISVHTLELEPSWDPLRSHPRFKRLLEKYSKKD
jgi:tetratricopeptide (TPR) repeat protein